MLKDSMWPSGWDIFDDIKVGLGVSGSLWSFSFQYTLPGRGQYHKKSAHCGLLFLVTANLFALPFYWWWYIRSPPFAKFMSHELQAIAQPWPPVSRHQCNNQSTQQGVVADGPVCHGLCGAKPAPSRPAAKRYVGYQNRNMNVKSIMAIAGVAMSLLCLPAPSLAGLWRYGLVRDMNNYLKTKPFDKWNQLRSSFWTANTDHWFYIMDNNYEMIRSSNPSNGILANGVRAS